MDDGIRAILDHGARDLFSGAALLVAGARGEERVTSYGTHAPDSATPITPGSLFDLASLTKPIVGTALLALVSRGLAGLDDPVHRWLPATRDPAKRRITMGDLLGHRGGLPPSPSPNLYASGFWDQGADAVIEELWRRPLQCLPGTQTTYSCVGYMVLGRLMEEVTGMGLGEVVERYVWQPLGVTGRFVYNPRKAGLQDEVVATEAERPTRGPQLPGVVHDGNAFALGGVSANAGLFGDLEAVSAFGQAWLDGSIHRKLGIDEGLTRGLFRESGPSTDRLTRNRAGWLANVAQAQQPALDETAFGHTGFTGTSFWVDPVAGRAYVVLTNAVAKSGYSTGGMGNIEYRKRLTGWRRELHRALAEW
jgi:CubicO group peptidase (beta-lactamase class C family)